MNNEKLHRRLKKLVHVERRIGVEVLECLYQFEKRKAYFDLKYDGLFSYCVKELSFTEAQATQRILAMRALKELPELKPRIESGSLSVTTVAKVQTHFRQEKKAGVVHTLSEKSELFLSMEGRSSREVDARLCEVRGEPVKRKVVLELDEESYAMWVQVKNLAAHKTLGNEAATLKMLASEWLKKNDPAGSAKKIRSESQADENTPEKAKASQPLDAMLRDQPRLAPKNPRYIPASVRKLVWKRDQSKCTRCDSRFALEVDHVTPVALGGQSTPENLRILCRPCNQSAAIAVFGIDLFNQYRAV